MKRRKILALALSVGLAAQPVVSAVAPSVALAGVSISNSNSPFDRIRRTTRTTTTLEIGSVSVGKYEYRYGESAPFVIGAEDEVKVWVRAGFSFAKKRVELYQEQADGTEKVLASDTLPSPYFAETLHNDTVGLTLTFKGTALTKPGKVYLRTTLNDSTAPSGAPTKTVAVPLNVMERVDSDYKFPDALDIGLGQIFFRIPGAVALIGGESIYFGGGKIPFKHSMEKDGTRTATINVDPNTLKAFDGVGGPGVLEKAQKNYEDLTGGGVGGFALRSLVPWWKIAAVYRWNPQIPRKNGASLAFNFGLKGGVTGTYYCITGDLDFVGLLGYKGSYGIDYNGNTTVAVGPTGSLELRLGVGFGHSYVGRVGAYGKGNLDAWALIYPVDARGWESVTLKGELGAEVVALSKRVVEWAILKGGPYEIVKRQHPYLVTASAQELLERGDDVRVFDSNNATLIEEDLARDYLGRTSGWLGNEQVYAQERKALSTAAANDTTTGLPASWEDPRVLQESGYPDAQVSIAQTPAGKLMVWLRDDSSRSGANRSQLVWSRYDAAADAWSEPQPVDGDATADFDPCLYVDDAGAAHVAWLNAADQLPDGLDIAQTAERLGMSYAVLESGGTAFSAAEQVAPAQAGEAKSAPQLAADNGSVVVGWSTFEAQHLVDLGGTHGVRVATRSNGAWEVRNAVQGTMGAIGSLTAGATKDGPAVAWTEDKDGKADDTRDATLSVLGAGQTATKQLASGSVSCAQYVASGENADVLTWKSTEKGLATAAEGETDAGELDSLWKTASAEASPELVVSGVRLPNSYKLSGSLDGEALLSYAAVSGGGATVYGRTLSGGELSDEDVLVEHADNITAWDVAGLNDDMAVAFAAERGVGTGSSEADLCVASDKAIHRLKLEGVTVEGDEVPGATVELVAQVTNAGLRTLDGTTIKVVDDGQELAAVTHEGKILPGETVEVRVPYQLADDFTYDPNRAIDVHACFPGTAGLARSSKVSVPLAGDARIEANPVDMPYGDQELVAFELSNHGVRSCSGTARISAVDNQGAERELGSVAFGPLGAGETQVVEVTPTAATFGADGVSYVSLRLESEQLDQDVLTGAGVWGGDLLDYNNPTETGWSFENGSWYVGETYSDGSTGHKLGWHWDQGWYFLNYLTPESDGEAVSGWATIDEKTYWFNTRHDGRFGRMATGWLFTDGAWYLMAPSGEMVRGWAWDGATRAWYYLAEDGRMLRDTTTPDGERVDAQGRWVA